MEGVGGGYEKNQKYTFALARAWFQAQRCGIETHGTYFSLVAMNTSMADCLTDWLIVDPSALETAWLTD